MAIHNAVRLDLENDLEDTALCYVEQADFPPDVKDAYFTSIALDEQPGTDWDEPLGESGLPERREVCGGGKGKNKVVMVGRQWLLICVEFRCAALKSPLELNRKCPYTPNQINAHMSPWLSSSDKSIKIFAGATLEEFIEKIRELGGEILGIAIS